MFLPGEFEKLLEVVKSVRPEVMVEIGCHEGRTAAACLHQIASLRRYIGIEVRHGYVPSLIVQRGEIPSRPGHLAMRDPRFNLRLFDHGSLDIDPSQTETLLMFGPVDVVFIDGDHSAPAVRHDSRLARTITHRGGAIIWHDYTNPKAEVTEVLDEDIRRGYKIEHIANTWLAVERIQ